MNSSQFYDLEIHPRILEAIQKSKVKDFIQVLTLSIHDISHITKLGESDVKQLQKSVAQKLFSITPITALQIFKNDCPLIYQKRFLSTGCAIIDRFLKGGLQTHTLTEISGESASGKTQLCLQLCLLSQLSYEFGGLNSGAIYISTEDIFPSKRLLQMNNRLKTRCKEFENVNFMDKIYVEHSMDFEDLQRCINIKLPQHLIRGTVKLVIIDSVAAILRSDLSEVTKKLEENPLNRSKQISSIGNQLQELAYKYDVCFVLVNQVMDNFNSYNAPVQSSQLYPKVPALGMLWANMMHVRLQLSRTYKNILLKKTDGYIIEENKISKLQKFEKTVPTSDVESDQVYMANVRILNILSAPHLPNLECKFIVDEDGVKGIDF